MRETTEVRSTRFAARLRAALDESTNDAVRLRRQRRAPVPVFTPTANPQRVRYSDELFVDRVRHALD